MIAYSVDFFIISHYDKDGRYLGLVPAPFPFGLPLPHVLAVLTGGGFSFVLSDTVYQSNRGDDVRPDCKDNSDYVFGLNGYHLFSMFLL